MVRTYSSVRVDHGIMVIKGDLKLPRASEPAPLHFSLIPWKSLSEFIYLSVESRVRV